VSTVALPIETTSRVSAARPPRRRRRVDVLTFGLGLWSILVYAFLFIPIGFVVAHSFTDSNSFLIWGGFTTRWYSRLWENEPLKQAIKNSLVAAAGSTLIAVVLGGFAGVALARRGGGWVKPFLVLVFLILVTPEIVDAIGYLIWFVRLGGPLDDGYVRLWIGHSVFSSAVVTLIVRARLAGLDESLEEAAADLGATPARAFRQITLPLIAPALLAGGLLAFTFSLDNTIVSQFVSVAGKTTFPVYVFSSVRQVMKPDVGAAASLMLLLTLVALAIVALVLRRSGDTSSEVAATLAGG
jgi:ABC-type spermidine/putrescine transport system permease subunit II